MEAYQILVNPLRIKCLNCGHISENLDDINEKYCGSCYVFHDNLRQMTAQEIFNDFNSASIVYDDREF